MNAATKALPPVLTVSGLTAAIKAALEGKFQVVDLEGEIGVSKKTADNGLIPSSTGHYYFTLKDAEAQISAVLYKWDLESSIRRGLIELRQLRDGAKVKVRGSVSVYPPRGTYQLVVKLIRPEGEGDLMRQFLELKAKLAAAGLFDPARKRPLPFLPQRIGIVTSETGAVIHDMCTVLTRRFPRLQIRLYPAMVQGVEAPKQLLRGIAYFQTEWVPDVLIVGRGGGSFEDLFCFNDEELVRAVAASSVPVISAVGHETDFTLCDFAADVRAGTPSIAAELVVPVRDELLSRLNGLDGRMAAAVRSRNEFCAQRIDQLSDRLAAALDLARTRTERRLAGLMPRLKPALILRLSQVEKRLAVVASRLEPALALRLQVLSARLEKAEAKLTAYSPYGVLERGYSLTTTADGTVIREATAVKTGERLTTRLARGTVESVAL